MRALLPLALLLSASLSANLAHADESLPAPSPDARCQQPPKKKAVRAEYILSRWPDNTIKAKQITYLDKSTLHIYWHPNGQRKLETHQVVILIDGNPRHRRHVTHGAEKRWHANGQLFVCALYDEGNKTGTWIYYDRNGTPAASFRYVDGKEVEHLTYSRVFGWRHFGWQRRRTQR